MIPKQILLSLCAVLLCSSSLLSQKPMLAIAKFGDNPGKLKMYMHVPEKVVNPSEKKPLVIVLHGCSQSASSVADASGWNHLSDRNGFYVLYPETNVKNNLSGCFNWFQPANNTKDQGELASIMSMIDFALAEYPIDEKNISVYGVSAGAAMAIALMANYPHKFKSGASIAGIPYGVASNAIKASKAMADPVEVTSDQLKKNVTDVSSQYQGDYPKLIVMQGMKDPVVDPRNADQLVQQWLALHNTDTTKVRTEEQFNKNKDVTKYVYTDSFNDACVVYFKINNVGHKIPVDADGSDSSVPTATASTGAGYFTRDKNFFSTYWIAVEMGLVVE
jgi:poly(hydroxyalkanoate) depolymerase family esterase